MGHVLSQMFEAVVVRLLEVVAAVTTRTCWWRQELKGAVKLKKEAHRERLAFSTLPNSLMDQEVEAAPYPHSVQSGRGAAHLNWVNSKVMEGIL